MSVLASKEAAVQCCCGAQWRAPSVCSAIDSCNFADRYVSIMSKELIASSPEGWRLTASDAVAGAIAGVCSDGVLHPVDTVKSRLQAQGGPPWVYRSMTHAVRQIVAKEGVRRGLYAGFGAVLAGSLPTHAIMFATYKATKRAVDPIVSEDLVPAVDLCAGAIGEVCGLVTYLPSEVVAKRLQVATGCGPARNYDSALHAVRVIKRTEGFAGLYTGLLPTVLRDVPYTAIQFALFEKGKRLLTRGGTRDVTDAQAAGLGLVVGATAAVVTNPFDVVKTRIQVQEGGSQRKYRGVLHCFKRIIQEEGLLALARGVGPRVIWIAPGSAITLGVYEAVSRHLRSL